MTDPDLAGALCRALFGLDAARLQPLIRDAAQAVQQWHHDCRALCLPYPHYWPIPSNFRYRRKTRTLDRAVHALIGEVRARGGDHHGLLGAMLQVRDEDGSPISDQEIRDQVVTARAGLPINVSGSHPCRVCGREAG